MNHGSLFSGIGGFDLAAEWMGWTNVFHCEWKEFNQTILKYYWPNAKSYSDITTTDFSIHRGVIDILTGGFPCQPYSVAGKRKGKEDDRHLWPEMLRAIREIQPKYVVGENVGGIVSWNGGLVFDEVQTDLENEGYEVQSFILPACAVNAPHRRDRVWFIANSYSNGYKSWGSRKDRRKKEESEGQRIQWERVRYDIGGIIEQGNVANTEGSSGQREHEQQQRERGFGGQDCRTTRTTTNNNNKGLQGSEDKGGIRESWQESIKQSPRFLRTDWEEFPTVSPICNGNDGIPSKLDSITFPKWRIESIQAGGNAIVPQVAYEIFKAIKEIETKHKK